MSMSTIVIGFRPPDAKWKLMKKIYDNCQKAGIEIPKEVEQFFGGAEQEPDPSGVEVEIDAALTKYEDDSCSGYELHIDKLPKDVKIVRFYNSW